MLSSVFRPMDMQGQRLAEQLLVRLLLVAAAASFVIGYAQRSFHLMVQINGAAVALVALLVLPPWPWYSRNPLSWLPPLNPVSRVSGGGGKA